MTRKPLWQQRIARVFSFQGPVLIVIGLALFIPLIIAVLEARGLPSWHEVRSYLIPAIIALTVGLIIGRQRAAITNLSANDALLITTAAWLVTGLVGSLPYIILLLSLIHI